MSLKKITHSWKLISAVSIILTLIVMISLNSLFPRTMEAYRITVLVSAISSFISLIVATQTTVYHHRIDTHPTSFIAQTKVAGKRNMKAFWWYLGFSIMLAETILLFGKLLAENYSHISYWWVLTLVDYLAAFSVIWMALVPINLSRFGHLGGVLGVVTFLSVLHVLGLTWEINLLALSLPVPLWAMGISWSFLIVTALYIVAYFWDLIRTPPKYFKPGLLQHLWVPFILSGVVALVWVFSNPELYAFLSL